MSASRGLIGVPFPELVMRLRHTSAKAAPKRLPSFELDWSQVKILLPMELTKVNQVQEQIAEFWTKLILLQKNID
ncbi:hypothetical protein GCM10023310_32580 [Paenibacillus vulneris]